MESPQLDRLIEECLYHLSADDDASPERFLAQHPEARETFDRVRRWHAEMEPRLRSWAAERALEPDAPQHREPGKLPHIPGFHLTAWLGGGGMGNVYRAEQLSPARGVALKIIPRRDEATNRRYLREIQTIARLRSPYIVTLFQSGTTEDWLYFAMEDLLEGETLEEVFRRWRNERPANRHRRAAELLLDACRGVAAIHSEGIVHRDIKPANVFLTSDGVVKLIDFGLAWCQGDNTLTRPDAVLGTLVYMSPEQARGAKHRVDPRSDVYSLGATLYEAATLEPPFGGPAENAVVARILGHTPSPPAAVDAHIPVDLAAIIEKCLEHEPGRRYHTAGELAQDLQAFLAGEEVKARPITRWGRMHRWAARRWRPLTLTAAALLCFAGAVLLTSELEELAHRRLGAESAIQAARDEAQKYRKTQSLLLPNAEQRIREADAVMPATADFVARRPLLEARQELHRLQAEALQHFDAAVISAQRGLELDSSNEPLRSFLTDLLWERYLEVESTGSDGERQRLSALLLNYTPSWEARLTARGTATIATTPPGAEIHLFKYEPVGLLLQPIPYTPDGGLRLLPSELPKPVLRVVRQLPPSLAGLELCPGDRVLKLDGRPVDQAGNRALRTLVGSSRPLRLDIERSGMTLRREAPPGTSAGSPSAWSEGLVYQLSACLEADVFPLDVRPEWRLGRSETGPLDLEAGSYLALIRLAGYRDTRFPFVIGRDERVTLHVDLYTDEEIGADFVHVPGGSAILGGDPVAFFPEPRRVDHIPSFFIARHEAAIRLYYEMLNDPLLAGEIRQELAGNEGLLLPTDGTGAGDEALYRTGRVEERTVEPRHLEPVIRGISRLAAERFVAWLNDREASRGSARRYALPGADELEKAARGADGRPFPWGREFDWSLVSSFRSSATVLSRWLAFATDASPYDVRDLAGSLAEMTTRPETSPIRDATADQGEMRVKGGSCLDDLEPFFRVGGHTRARIKDGSPALGFRLVVHPPQRRP